MKVLRAIDEASMGAPVGVIGHSMGGLIAAEVEEQAQVEGIEVEAFVGIAAPFYGVKVETRVGPYVTRTELSPERAGKYVPRDLSKWITFAAGSDATVAPSSALIAGTEQVMVPEEDHSSIVKNDDVAEVIAEFLLKQFSLALDQEVN